MPNDAVLPRVTAMVEAGHPEEATALLDAALVEDPEFFLYHVRRAEIARMAGDTITARKAYSRALALCPEAEWIALEHAALGLPRPGERFAGSYLYLPDTSKARQEEGGRRLVEGPRQSTPHMPLVTIVTAVYDNKTTFQRCIESVRAQTYPNVEYIVVDGGSPEATLAVLRANEDVVDYYVSEPDRGIYSAMNKGIAAAGGDYVCLLNSDDVYAPDFVEKTLARARETGADIVYTDYAHGETKLKAQPIGPGVLFGHLDICHNTFLVSRRAYDCIGPYEEGFRIVSDAVWIRAAWCAGLNFEHVPETLFTLTEGGLSSGSSEARRQLFISEVVESYRRVFPRLSPNDAEEIYLFRFNKARATALIDRVQPYLEDNGFRDALCGYVEYCAGMRANFALSQSDAETHFSPLARLCELVGADPKCIRLLTKEGPLHDVLARLDTVIDRRKADAKTTILHFVTVFSAPSETFIYDLVRRLDATEEVDNFVLYEHEKLAEERPYDRKLQVFWSHFPTPVAEWIYKYVIGRLAPDALIAHFAINAYRFHERTAPSGIQLPTVVMTHGIDVYHLKRDDDYTRYVTEELARRHDVVFTAVSNYLRRELCTAGVGEQKVSVIPNTANPAYFAHRKSDGFYDGRRTLKLLNVGRLVEWKGHHLLLEALAHFRETCTEDFHLTIVYGGGGDRHASLTDQAAQLGLSKHVTFEPFVDFAATPEYFAHFDLYLHASTYAQNKLGNSETFGIAVLEAISAGLPVITTDAGGLPEVVGAPGRFARVVSHGDAQVLADALAETWREGRAFADNRSYAEARLAAFSPKRQTLALSELVAQVSTKPLDVALLSTSTNQGAGYAAFRLHRGLGASAVRPHLFTTIRKHEAAAGVTVVEHPLGDSRGWQVLQPKPKPGKTIFSLDQTHIPTADLLQLLAPYDIVNLHWHARFLSVENVAALTRSGKPVVLTVRDMHPITGGCHFFHGCEGWLQDCTACPQIPSTQTDFPAEVLAAKRAGYDFDNLTLVALSSHTRRILERAPSFRDCRIEVIPNSIETDVFRPHDRAEVRAELGLPRDRPIIGYVPSFSSEVKGYRELMQAFNHLARHHPDLDPFVMLVGNKTPATQEIGFDKMSLGYIADNAKLARAYSAADVVVVPSLEETFSNTTAEAISCGVPVVGFATGAIPDLAIPGRSGEAVPVGDAKALSEALFRVLTGPDLSASARAHAEGTLSFMRQAEAYAALFFELASAPRSVAASDRVAERFGPPARSLARIATEQLLARTE